MCVSPILLANKTSTKKRSLGTPPMVGSMTRTHGLRALPDGTFLYGTSHAVTLGAAPTRCNALVRIRP